MQGSIVLGPGVLGQEAFAKQQRAASTNSGSIGLGPALLKPFVPTGSKAAPAVPAEKLVAPGKVAVPVAPVKKVAKKRPSAPEGVTFSETDVQVMLANDPNTWDAVLEAEAQRPDGVRKIVASLVLAAAEQASARPVPETVLATLREVVAS